MSRCTCSTDKEVTCIVHPTDRSLKDRIQKLENRVEKWKRYWDEADRRGDSLEAKLAAAEADAAAERDKVRVLREALEYAVKQVPEIGTVPGVKEALATTEQEDV